MKHKNIIAVTFILSAAAIIVMVLAHFMPDYAAIILSAFLGTVTLLSVCVATFNIIFNRNKTTIDTSEISDIIENLNTEMLVWTNDCSAVFMNKSLRRLLGIESVDFDHKETIKRIFGIDTIDNNTISKLIRSELGESSFTNADGETTYIVWSTSLFKQNKNYSLYLSTGFNLTEIKNMQINLANMNKQINLSMEISEIGILMTSDRLNFHASSEIQRMLGLDSGRLGVNEFRNLIHTNDKIQYDSCLKMLETDNNWSDVRSIELRIKSAGGIYRWYSFRFKAIKDSNDELALFGGALLDITERREKDMLIERLAYIDEVTGIANRNKLLQIGQETYECCHLLDFSYWVIVLDIDRFHLVNDTCGYDKGNQMLEDFAHLLYKYVGNGGLAARISGDNFALILRDYGDDELPSRTVLSIQEDMTKLSALEFASINLTCSAGYSRMPSDGNCFLDVLEHAEFALKSCNQYQGNISCYEPSMHDSIIGDTELEKALGNAIDNNELHLFYQPKINLSTGKIMGVEALVRWIKPDGTIVRPDAFVPIAESSHLIGRISEFVLNEACRQNMMWQRMGYPNIVMSINFASSDFYQKDLKDKVFEALARTGLAAEWLEVELTETLALRDIDFAVSQMNKLRELGVQLAMDDFGTGYSSLSYLQVLPITLLKLDRSFITNIEHDNIAYEIVSAVIKIAKSKKIETIAEGIENTNQADILRSAGCDFAQGYLYGKPMPPEQIQQYFEEYSGSAAK
ncbi:MAG: EAL domain-containing protein [Ruminococcus sp.]|nr:EAL domain-containing protein [Ruminococcus sp.]